MTHAVLMRTVFLLWMGVFALWAISSFAVKRTTDVAAGEGKSRLAVWAVSASWWIVLWQAHFSGPWAVRFVPEGEAADYTGLALTVVGLLFAVWARFYLGRNWDAMVVLKEDHQLVRTGPYAVVRHPIYSGFMLATLGTAIVQGEAWRLLAMPLIVGAWGYKSRVEERFLIQRFGSEYEQYQREVKALVPGIW